MPDLFSKPVEAITSDDLQAVIGWPESLNLEFKESLPAREGRTDAWVAGGNIESYARDKLFKEVVAFANAGGGHLLVGVAESDESPRVAVALTPLPRCVELAERLSRAAQSIDPPIPLLLIQGVQTHGDAGIIIFRVPASWAAPHRAPDKECYIRRGTESIPMGMREIRDLTLAANSRAADIDARFSQASMRFRNWQDSLLEGRPSDAAFRITAIPMGTVLTLGRLVGREGLFCTQQRYSGTANGVPIENYALRSPTRSRPILRGVRRTFDVEGVAVYFEIFSDGTVDLGFRRANQPRAPERTLAMSWILGHAINVLRTVDNLRKAAGIADAEYGVEFEFLALPISSGLILRTWGDDYQTIIGDGVGPLPLVLPRLSFGPLRELDEFLSLVITDLCDAAGAYNHQPLSIHIELPSD